MYKIEWDMGTYGPFTTYGEARTYQRDHRMKGSAITQTDDDE